MRCVDGKGQRADADLDVVSEGAGREAASERRRARVLCELENGALSGRSRADGDDFSRVLDGDDRARGHQQLLPRPFQVQYRRS